MTQFHVVSLHAPNHITPQAWVAMMCYRLDLPQPILYGLAGRECTSCSAGTTHDAKGVHARNCRAGASQRTLRHNAVELVTAQLLRHNPSNFVELHVSCPVQKPDKDGVMIPTHIVADILVKDLRTGSLQAYDVGVCDPLLQGRDTKETRRRPSITRNSRTTGCYTNHNLL